MLSGKNGRTGTSGNAPMITLTPQRDADAMEPDQINELARCCLVQPAKSLLKSAIAPPQAVKVGAEREERAGTLAIL
jgi:hypothetical protein